MKSASCAVCDANDPNLIRVGDASACESCVRAVAKWIASNPTERLDWTTGDVAHLCAIATGYTHGALSEEDIVAHVDLAIAYGEMGLQSDAALTASLAIVGGSEGPVVRRAAEVLLREGAGAFEEYRENQRRS